MSSLQKTKKHQFNIEFIVFMYYILPRKTTCLFFSKGYTTSLFKKELPIPLSLSQCVLHKHELLICGDQFKRACYSYHTLKDEYKFICEYPSHVKLFGHCVVKLVDRNSNNDKYNNQITLLSFGSDLYGKNKHTLVMKY
ncbi:hypothetical protein RFI_22193, partial [Reticulomyxa filosa]